MVLSEEWCLQRGAGGASWTERRIRLRAGRRQAEPKGVWSWHIFGTLRAHGAPIMGKLETQADLGDIEYVSAVRVDEMRAGA